MEATIRRLVVLYADVSGSTRLYEQFGDEIARADIAVCIDLLSRVTKRMNGQVVKTIGDEVMCVFPGPAKAAVAASEMQIALRDAGESNRFRSGPLRIKIGWHHGEASWEGEVHGEAPITAQQLISMAKADEVLTSERSLRTLPPGLKMGARFVDHVKAEAWNGDLEVWELPWEDEAELTSVSSQPGRTRTTAHSRLTLECGNRSVCCDAALPRLRLGRGDDNELMVEGRFVSRVHVEVQYRNGRFHVRDNSTNGSIVEQLGGKRASIHREEMMLAGTGRLCLGATPEEDPDAVVRYRCE